MRPYDDQVPLCFQASLPRQSALENTLSALLTSVPPASDAELSTGPSGGINWDAQGLQWSLILEKGFLVFAWWGREEKERK